MASEAQIVASGPAFGDSLRDARRVTAFSASSATILHHFGADIVAGRSDEVGDSGRRERRIMGGVGVAAGRQSTEVKSIRTQLVGRRKAERTGIWGFC